MGDGRKILVSSQDGLGGWSGRVPGRRWERATNEIAHLQPPRRRADAGRPAKSLPMQAIMLYFSGSGVQIFSLGMIFMLVTGPIQAVSSILRGESQSEQRSCERRQEQRRTREHGGRRWREAAAKRGNGERRRLGGPPKRSRELRGGMRARVDEEADLKRGQQLRAHAGQPAVATRSASSSGGNGRSSSASSTLRHISAA